MKPKKETTIDDDYYEKLTGTKNISFTKFLRFICKG